MLNRRGFIPLILLLIIAAVAAIAGLAAVKNPNLSSSLPKLLEKAIQPQTKNIDQNIVYTAEGAAKASTVLVKFKPGVSDQTINSIHGQIGTKIKRVIKGINVQIVQLPANSHVADIVNQFKARGEVQYAEPNYIVQSFFTPNDPYFGSQWNLQKINAPQAWDSTQGGFGPIAVVDTGIDSSHPDLSGEVLSGYNFIGDNTDTQDDNGHGTHVAGIIESSTNNGTGVASIGFKGSLLPVKVLDSTGAGTDGDVASGITYATDNGAKIINLSLGGSSFSQTEQDAINYANQHGVVVVAAAGNNSNNAPVYPAADSGVLAVSASDSSDNLASFSSYGSDIFVSAPGVSITSTYSNGSYVQMSGTSMAAPHLAGLLGLALSYQGSSGKNIIDAIKQTSDKVGSYPYDSNGWNQYFGYGRVDAGKLLTLLSGAAQSSPTPTASTQPQSTPTTQTGAAAPHATKVFSFNVDLEGTIDSIDLINSKIVVKISGISQNVGVYSGNLVDLFVNNQDSFLASLAVGERINAKAFWQDNKLTATQITVQGNASSQGNNPGSGNGNSGNSQSIPQNLSAPVLKSHPGKPF